MESIILLKPLKLSKKKKGIVDKTLSTIPFVKIWTVDWLDIDRIIRVVCHTTTLDLDVIIIEALAKEGIYTQQFID